MAAVLVVLIAALFVPSAGAGLKKKTAPASTAPDPTGPRIDVAKIDTSKLVWPEPPFIPRIRWINYFTGMPIDYSKVEKKDKKKQGWMDRLAGAQIQDQDSILKTFPWQFIGPYCIAIDSKNLVYVGDQRVGAIFIFNTETHDVQLIKNGPDAHFGLINGLAIDDDDRLFVADGKLHHILVFDKNHKQVDVFNEGMQVPNGIALDTENRLLYVVDTAQDQVLVYDADKFTLLRRIGTGGKNHWLTDAGNFAAPSDVAVDKDGYVYVTDMLNNRVEIFDADGQFVSQFGKHGDGPGSFAHLKGIAVDSDKHIWVVDQMQDTVQVYDKEGQILAFMGGHGNGPGTFASAAGIAIDKNNRVFVTDQYPGRMQMFRYITDAEAAKEKAKRDAEKAKDSSRSHDQGANGGGGH
jgi:DNA-binding beta-propeller fold protein YncE